MSASLQLADSTGYVSAVEAEGMRLGKKQRQLDEIEAVLGRAGYSLQDFAQFLNWRDDHGGVETRVPGQDNGTADLTPVKDYGHALVLARHFRGLYRWASHRGSWMTWTGKVWEPVKEERVAKIAADTLRADYAGQLATAADKTTIARLLALIRETCSYKRIVGALSFLRGWEEVFTRNEQWDADPWALNCCSGVIDQGDARSVG